MEVFPGPPGHWLFGNVLQLKDGSELEVEMKWSRKYGNAFSIQLGPFDSYVSLHHPDYAKMLVSSSEPKEELTYTFIEDLIGKGLLTLMGEKWAQHRRMVTPGFHYDILKSYIKLTSECAHIMLDKWASHSNTDQAFEMSQHTRLMALDNILRCAFSYKTNCQIEGEENAYTKAIYELTDIINLRIRTFPYHNKLIFDLSPHGFKLRKNRSVIISHTDEVIRKRTEALKEEKEMERVRGKRQLDFLDILLLSRNDSQPCLSDADIRSEVESFMFAGHDTAATALVYTMYCLACNPEHQKKCRDEVMQVLDGKDSFDWEDLSKIPYTTMCIKESIRLYPPVPEIARTLTKPMTFCDGRTLPAGSYVGANVYGIHRNPDVWENPDVFDPLRFLPENVSKRSVYAFLPFSAGPRNCLGQTFAMNELKVVTALTLKRYELIEDPALKPRIAPKLVLKSLNGVHMKIRLIES